MVPGWARDWVPVRDRDLFRGSAPEVPVRPAAALCLLRRGTASDRRDRRRRPNRSQPISEANCRGARIASAEPSYRLADRAAAGQRTPQRRATVRRALAENLDLASEAHRGRARAAGVAARPLIWDPSISDPPTSSRVALFNRLGIGWLEIREGLDLRPVRRCGRRLGLFGWLVRIKRFRLVGFRVLFGLARTQAV
jgi:hypothetical protein